MNENEVKQALKLAETLELTDEERAKKRGQFVALPSGNTHYEMAGEGEAVVLVHGYATPYYIYDKLFDGLVALGYKVLRYDLLGRGFSERVNKVYDAELFATQLHEISSFVFGDEAFLLVGTSMGGTICATFFKAHPEKVKKLALLAPAGMDTFKPPLYMKLCKPKGLGELIFNGVAGGMLLKKCCSELYNVSDEEKDYYQREFAESIKYKGFLACTLSSLRNTILKTSNAMIGYRAIAERELPLLVIWGTIDKTMPYYQHARMLEVCKHVKLVTYENSGHIFVFDEGERTTKDVVAFFKGEDNE